MYGQLVKPSKYHMTSYEWLFFYELSPQMLNSCHDKFNTGENIVDSNAAYLVNITLKYTYIDEY